MTRHPGPPKHPKKDRIDTERIDTEKARIEVVPLVCPRSRRSRTAVEAIFTPDGGPQVSELFEPALIPEFHILFETVHVSAERMLHITPDEIELTVRGRFRIQTRDESAAALPLFLRGPECIEGELQLNLSRGSTFVIQGEFGHHPLPTRAPRRDLCMTVTFLGHREHEERLHAR